MLLKFSAQNYRSIKQRVELDLIGSELLRAEREPDAGIRSKEWGFRVLPSLALFGQNGAGKSTILQALLDALVLILFGSLEPTEPARVNMADTIRPFALDAEAAAAPTTFEITMLVNTTVYVYSIILRGTKILSEKLTQHAPRSEREIIVFDRKQGAQKGMPWNFGGIFEPYSGVLLTLSSNLKDSALFLPLIFKTIDDPEVSGLSVAFRNYAFPFSPRHSQWHKKDVLERIRTDKKFAEQVRRLLCLMDIRIESVEARGEELFFHHKNTKGSTIALPFNHESDGTHQLTILSGVLLKALHDGQLVLIDELDSHLHPLITHQIISLFQSPKVNENNAQLIFTTHDTTLLDQDLMRRDQIYFVNNKGANGTTVESLESYHVRKDLALQRAYLEGRLSGLPTLRYPEEVHGGIKELLNAMDRK